MNISIMEVNANECNDASTNNKNGGKIECGQRARPCNDTANAVLPSDAPPPASAIEACKLQSKAILESSSGNLRGEDAADAAAADGRGKGGMQAMDHEGAEGGRCVSKEKIGNVHTRITDRAPAGKLSAAAAAADACPPAPQMLLKGGAHSSTRDVVMEKWPTPEVMLSAAVE